MWPFKKKKEVELPKSNKPINSDTISEKDTDKGIYDKLEICLKDFYELNNKEYLIKNFEDYDLRKNFDDIAIYDFECMVEDVFFNGLDIIPDGTIKTIKGFVDFIKNNK